jgi:hypothetical protein
MDTLYRHPALLFQRADAGRPVPVKNKSSTRYRSFTTDQLPATALMDGIVPSLVGIVTRWVSSICCVLLVGGYSLVVAAVGLQTSEPYLKLPTSLSLVGSRLFVVKTDRRQRSRRSFGWHRQWHSLILVCPDRNESDG